MTTDDEQLREIDVASGSTVRVVADPFAGDGVFRGLIRLAPDRSTIWFSEGYEDGWFDCGSSLGSIGRIDPGTGAIEVIAEGYGVEPSADGTRIAYVSSTVCVPDPDNEEFWVLTPGDRVIVRELAGGTERAFVTDVAPDSYDSPSSVQGVWFGPRGDLYVLTGDGVLRNVDTTGSTVIQDHPVVSSDVIGLPVAATATDLITQVFGDEGSTDVYAVDLSSGAARLLGSSEEYATVGVSRGGDVIVAADVEVTVAPGAELTLIIADDGAFDDDAFVLDIDW